MLAQLTETKTGMVVNSAPSVPYHQNLPDLRPFSSRIVKNWDSLQSLGMGNENGFKPGRFWFQETEEPEFVVIEIVL
jgi:hypothetical protein